MSKSTNMDSERGAFPPLGSSYNVFLSPISTPSTSNRSKAKLQSIPSKILEDINTDDIHLDLEEQEAQGYFKPDPEDSREEEDEDIIRKKLHSQRDENAYITDFKFCVFLKFFIMHMLFFCCMGPFIVLLAPVFGWKILKNQDFLPCSFNYFRQTFEFCIIVSFLIVFYMTETPGLQAIEIYMLLVGVIVRMLIISSKYAYQSELVLKLAHSTVLTEEDKVHDLMLGEWRLQTDGMITEELQAAILRLEIDSPLFFFNFLGKCSENLRTKLSRKINPTRNPESLNAKPGEKGSPPQLNIPHAKTMEDHSPKGNKNIEKGVNKFAKIARGQVKKAKLSSNSVGEAGDLKKFNLSKSATAISSLFLNFLKPQKLEAKYLLGYNLAFDIRKNARAFKVKRIGKTCLFFSLIRGLLPTFYRLYLIYHKGEDISVLTEKPYIVIVAFLLNSFLFWANTYILSIAVQDFTTKVWCFKQLGFLICPRKIHEFKTRKLYPTLNIFDPVTIKTWSSLRKIMKEYGKKYIMRNNFNITVCMTLYSLVLCTFVLQMLGVFKAYKDPLMLIVFGYESAVFFVIFVTILSGAAFLNNQYKVHKNLLKKNKNIISDFAKLSYLYVGKDAIKPDNIIYKQGLKMLRKELGDEDFENKLIARSEKLISMIDETIEELEFEEANEPFTVMGIKVDYNLLKSLAIGLGSLVFALVQNLVNK